MEQNSVCGGCEHVVSCLKHSRQCLSAVKGHGRRSCLYNIRNRTASNADREQSVISPWLPPACTATANMPDNVMLKPHSYLVHLTQQEHLSFLKPLYVYNCNRIIADLK